jgi:hypothetical protein
VRLSTFADVESSTPHLVVCSELRGALPGAFIDFAFLPSRRDASILRDLGASPFFGVFSSREADEFDLVFVSNSYALELVNAPDLFRPGLRRYSERRAEGIDRPLYIVGGSNAGAISSAYGLSPAGAEDSLFDGAFRGEGEGRIGPLAKALLLAPGSASDRLKRAATEIPGFRPTGWDGPEIFGSRADADASTPDFPVFDSPHAKTIRLEIARGCPAFCSFCFEGWDRKPYRERPVGRVMSEARAQKKNSGAAVAELYCFNFNVHSEILTILYRSHGLFSDVKALSQRADVLARYPALLDAELAAGKRSYTVGIEGISARMRAYYRKSVSDDELRRAIAALLSRGVREIKFFFIVAGFEDEDDLRDFASLLGFVARTRSEHRDRTRVMLSAGYLVRYPDTPLYYDDEVEPGRHAEIASAMGEAATGLGLEFRVAADFREFEACRFLVSGKATMDDLIKGADSGARFDSALRRFAVPRDADRVARYEGISPAAVKRGVIERFGQEARAFSDAGYCLGRTCLACGACADRDEIDSLVAHSIRLPGDRRPIDAIAKRVAEKNARKGVRYIVRVGMDCVGASDAAIEARVLRDAFRVEDGLVDSLLDVALVDFPGWDTRSTIGGRSGEVLIEAFAALDTTYDILSESLGWKRIGTDQPLSIEVSLEPTRKGGIAMHTALETYLHETRVRFAKRRTEDGIAYSAADLGRKILQSAHASENRLVVKCLRHFSVPRLGAVLDPRAVAPWRLVETRFLFDTRD